MNLTGLIIGASTFVCIGVFHPIVIKAEYHLGTRCWWAFLLLGLVCIGGSILAANDVVSTLLSVVAFSSLWSILELFKQKKRVERGWFPQNPKRKQ